MAPLKDSRKKIPPLWTVCVTPIARGRATRDAFRTAAVPRSRESDRQSSRSHMPSQIASIIRRASPSASR